MNASQPPLSNVLSEARSLYLRQHANNPVAWQTWGEAAFSLARQLDRPLIISIGYSSCHWCHVMERECFEDHEVAEMMNALFIPVKVDREEYPDVDHLYMEALQLMTGQGGWPLNCFVLPDKRPVYGGTYFPKDAWMKVLTAVSRMYRQERQKILEYAGKMQEALTPGPLLPAEEFSLNNDFAERIISKGLKDWIPLFDREWGGTIRVPKFPVPSTLQFLMEYGTWTRDAILVQHALVTLEKIALGGIHDHLSGGFARYSTDRHWKVPHFEKMLYDNAQLLSAFSKASQIRHDPLFGQAIENAVAFLRDELQDPEGGFYCAVDADSEGEEGAYYVWELGELKDIAGEHYAFLEEHFFLSPGDEWEHGKYILMARKPVNGPVWDALRPKLKEARNKREKPVTDEKILTGWNALAITGLCDAWLAYGNPEALEMAVNCGHFLRSRMVKADGTLWRVFAGKEAYVEGRLEDYSLIAAAFLKLNEVTGESDWMKDAERISRKMTELFYDPSTGNFSVGPRDAGLPVAVADLYDNVIPSAASQAFRNLFRLHHSYPENDWGELVEKAVSATAPYIERHLASFTNWALLLAEFSAGLREISLKSPAPAKDARGFYTGLVPFLWIRSLRSRETEISVCHSGSCFPSVTTIQQALAQISDR